jgi:enamine deaminase RidA (YjgF/YER057c/UK114 family)
MSQKIEQRLKELGIELPGASAPAANYVPYVITGNLVFISGQLCMWNGERRYPGKVGAEVSVEDAIEAAKLCGLNLITWLKDAAGGDLDRVARVVKLGGFVNSIADFSDQPKVINGCSNLMVDVFGDKGKHARAAVGVNVLPFNLAVEVEGVFELEA